MRLHIDVLGLLHRVWGGLGALAGLSLVVLAVGTATAFFGAHAVDPARGPGVWLVAFVGLAFIAGGLANFVVGGAIVRRRPRGRSAALGLAVPNLVFVPFGTALGLYAFWVLLNDDARRAFGQEPHGSQKV